MTENRKFGPEMGALTPEMGLPEHKQTQTGWPAIAILVFLFAGVFAGGCVISGKSPDEFYREWAILIWVGAAFLVLCILAELSRLKCPSCRSRAITLVSEQEVDRWIGQKVVNEDSFGVGGFQTFGGPKFKGITGGVAVTRRIIPVTKRCVLRGYCCDSCGRQFERRDVEEMG